MQRGVRVCMCIVQGCACVPACVVQRGVHVCARLCVCACKWVCVCVSLHEGAWVCAVISATGLDCYCGPLVG